MTTTSSAGTPLIIAVLALCVSFLSAMGSIAAVLVARANLQQQIQATAREAWRRELRQQAAELLRVDLALRSYNRDIARGGLDLEDLTAARREMVKLREAFFLSYNTVDLLIAERGEPQRYAAFLEAKERLFVTMERGSSEAEIDPLRQEFTQATTDILRREWAAIETDRAIRWQPWLQLKAWLGHDPPKFPDP